MYGNVQHNYLFMMENWHYIHNNTLILQANKLINLKIKEDKMGNKNEMDYFYRHLEGDS